MSRYHKDEGIVLAKKNLLNGKRLVIIFTKQHGKIALTAYGVRKLTSRRLSHLETGNYISFSFYQKNTYYYLSETDLIFAYSKIKKSGSKLSLLFVLLSVLSKIVPAHQEEPELFAISTAALKNLNNRKEFAYRDLLSAVSELLEKSGFVSREQINSPSFDPIAFIEDLTGAKTKVYTF